MPLPTPWKQAVTGGVGIATGGIASIALGAWAIGNPDRSVLLLVTVIGVFAIFRGIADLVAGFQFREMRDEVEHP